jgi:hypothetical protein
MFFGAVFSLFQSGPDRVFLGPSSYFLLGLFYKMQNFWARQSKADVLAERRTAKEKREQKEEMKSSRKLTVSGPLGQQKHLAWTPTTSFETPCAPSTPRDATNTFRVQKDGAILVLLRAGGWARYGRMIIPGTKELTGTGATLTIE